MSLNGTSIVMTFEPLSISQRKGAIVVAVFALLSTLALAFIALRTIRLAIILFLKHIGGTSRPPEILFFRTQLGNYAGCLILSNMFMSAAGLIDFSWVSRSGLSRGPTCTAQVVLMQIGIWGTCWFTAAHGVHTLSSLGFHIRPARWRCLVNVALGWIIAFVAALVPLQEGNVYSPTGTSCSITRSHSKEILVLEALPIILGAIVSTAAYSVIFIILRGKLSVNSSQELRSSSSTSQRGEDRSEEYYKFIGMIICTMFWFPLAFVFLLLPFCITHIIMYAGRSVPFALNVFVDVCVSMLGFVNVVLLCNTFRVISPVYYGPRATEIVTETVKIFGHDASSGSPIVPRPTFLSQSTIPSNENSRRTYNSTRSSANHRGISWPKVDSSTELPSTVQVSYESTRTKVARTKVVPLVLNSVMPSAELSRYPRIVSAQSSPKRQDIDFQSGTIVDSSSRRTALSPCPPPTSFVTADTRHKLSTQDEGSSFQPMADSDAVRKGVKEPIFKSKAPPALDLSRLSVPRFEVNTRGPGNAGESTSRPSSLTPSMMLSNDSDSHYSREIVHVYNLRPLPQVPEPSDDERNTVGSYDLTPRSLRGLSYMTVTTVWSQESGCTMSQYPDTESQEAYRQLVVDVVVPGMILGDQLDMGEAMSRQATPGLRGHHPETPLRPIKLPAPFMNMSSLNCYNSRPSTIMLLPNDSVV